MWEGRQLNGSSFFPVQKKKHDLNGAYHCPCSVFSLIFQFFCTSLVELYYSGGFSRSKDENTMFIENLFSVLSCSFFFFFTVLENDIMALGMICLLWQGQGNLAMKNIRNLVYRLQCI